MAQPANEKSEDLHGIYSRDKRVRWYEGDSSVLDKPRYAETRKLLETYSGISKENVVKHIIDIRDRAWNIWPYPCVGQFRFLDLSLGQLEWYPDVLKRAKQGQKLLDLGCCFAQDLRRLVADGVSSENLYASDMRQDFLDLGYELFLDKDTLKSTLMVANVFDENSPLNKFEGQIDIIVASSFFHLFSWIDQKRVAKRCIKLLRPQPGSLIIGRQTGSEVAGPRLDDTGQAHLSGTEPSRNDLADEKRWRHNDESWIKMWEDVGEETDTKWDVEVRADDAESWMTHNVDQDDRVPRRPMKFAVRRI